MENLRPLPDYLMTRYRNWKATSFRENSTWYRRLAEEGQRPRAMVISCCDSRVHVTSLFGAGPGEFFVHRNIANLIPPNEGDGSYHGTSSALEYAVVSLRVAHLVVVGHSGCGGVGACHAMCAGKAPELEHPQSFVGRWMDLLRPGFERVRHLGDEQTRIAALEREGVVVSLENAQTFPFVRAALETGTLSLHGVWHDIATGDLEVLDAQTGRFQHIE